MKKRRLRKDECFLIRAMLAGKPEAKKFEDELPYIYVEDMNDGGMGGVKFITQDKKQRLLGKILAEAEFVDNDGVPILVSLNLDREGRLYELDVWKVNFSPLRYISKDIQVRK